LTAFAAELRALRAAAGRPAYRELARRAHYSSSALADAAGGRRLPSLDITLAYVRACEGDEDAWRRRWHAVAAESVRAAEPASPRQVDGPAPYVGLAAFGTEDADRFAGREAMLDKLVARLSRQRFLALFGASGEGKSSVLKAGLLPAFPAARRVVLTPRPDPLEELAVQLSRLTGRPAARLHADFAEEPRALHLLARELLLDEPADADLLIVVDQFEELFTLCHDRDARSAFIALLLTAAQAVTSRARVVLGFRSDFYPHCAQHPDLAEALEDAQVLLGVMTPEEFRRAVTRPATAVGCMVESALVTQLVADAAGRTGALPLVSHALLETWHRRRGNTLTLAGYQAAGGIRSALTRTAEEVHTELPPARQDLARQLLLRLTAPGEGTDDTKRRVPRAELDALGDDVEPVLNALAEARLITLTGDEVDITHEALFQAWPRLRGWLDEDRAGLRIQRHLIDAAATWDDLDRDPGILFRTTRLTATVDWVNRARPALTTRERDFLDHSIAAEAHAHRSTRLRRRLLAAAVVALLIIATAVTIPVVRQRHLTAQMDLSRNLAARDTADSIEAARNAVAAYQVYPTVEARSSVLTAAVTAQGDHRRVPLGAKGSVSTAISPDGSRLAFRAEDSVVLLATDTLEQVAEFPVSGARAGLVGAPIQFTPDGQALVVREPPGHIAFIRLSDGQLLRSVETGAEGGAFAISPDGRTLAVNHSRTTSLWDTATGERIGELDVADEADAPPAFTDDNRTLAVAGSTGDVELWDLPTRSRVANLPSVLADGEATYLDFAPFGRFLATGHESGNVVLWDVAARNRIAVVARHIGGVYGVAFSPDGRVLVSSGESGRLALWDVESRTPLTDLPVDDPPRGDRPDLSGIWEPEFARDGTLIASSSSDLFVWRADQLPAAVGYGVADLRYDGSETLRALQDTGVLTTWHTTPDLRRAESLDLGEGPVGGRFSPDGKRLLFSAPGKPITIHDPSGGSSVELSIPGWPPPAGPARITAFANDGRHVLAVSTSLPVAVWDIDRPDSASIVTQWRDSDLLTGGAFLPADAPRVAIANLNSMVTIVEPATGKPVAELRGHRRPVTAIAPTPDGRLLATAGVDPEVILWNTVTWQEVGRLTGHTSAIWRAEVSPDGRLLATGSVDGVVILWDLATLSRWATLTGQPGPVTALAWSPDGKALATAGADSTIALWHTDPDTAIDKLCHKLTNSTEGPPSSCAD
jgi:WD40 repeat protein